MSESIQAFLNSQLQAPLEWRKLRMEDYPSPLDNPLPDSMIPLFGSDHFELLTQHERQILGVEFMRLNAEALILLELALLVGMRKHERKWATRGLRSAAQKLTSEEYLHVRGFRQFLNYEKRLNWRKEDLFLFRNRRCRRWLVAIATWQPTALCLPGAKIEAYSLAYSRHVQMAFGGWEKNSWTRLQQLHYLDEAFHVSMQFELYSNSFVPGWEAVKLATAMTTMICILQVLLLTGNWRMIAHAFPRRGFFERVLWTLRVSKWAVRSYSPYDEARSKMKSLLSKPGLPMGKLFRFMAW